MGSVSRRLQAQTTATALPSAESWAGTCWVRRSAEGSVPTQEESCIVQLGDAETRPQSSTLDPIWWQGARLMQHNYPESCRTLGIWPVLEVSSLCGAGDRDFIRNNLRMATEAAVTCVQPSVISALALAHAPAVIRLPTWKRGAFVTKRWQQKVLIWDFFLQHWQVTVAALNLNTYISQQTKYSLREAAKQLFPTELSHSGSESVCISAGLSPVVPISLLPFMIY